MLKFTLNLHFALEKKSKTVNTKNIQRENISHGMYLSKKSSVKLDNVFTITASHDNIQIH